LFLGLGYGFLLYCFFNFLNLGMYYFCYMYEAGFTISTPAEYQFYHFLFAFSALLFGQNIFFEFTLSKSKSLRKDTSREFTILHHSRMATWYTLFAGFAFCTTFKLLAYTDVFLLFDFLKIGWWASILVLLWLHFYMWMKVAKYFSKIYPVTIFMFFIIGILSFGLSHYDPVPYADTYRNKARNLMHYKLRINPPSSSIVSSSLMQKSTVNTIFVGDPKKVGTLDYGLNDAKGRVEDIPLFVENFNAKVPESRRGLIITSLVLDKNLKMKGVHKLLQTLSENNRLKISFAALPTNQNNPKVYYEYFDKGLLFTIPPTCDETKKVAEYLNRNPDLTIDFLTQVEDDNFKCFFSLSYLAEFLGEENFIKISSANQFYFDEKKIEHEDLFEKIKNVVWEKKEKAIFVFDVDDEATYEHYFFLRHEHKRAMNEVRNQEALISFGKRYEFLDKTKQREVRVKYPMIIEEFFSKEERFIFNFFKNKSSKN
jgi:biopolymer transport protein ExbD